MIDKSGNVKLIDFGLSNFLSDGKLGSTFCGTPAYAAPEMVW
jgi:serine/threonine protein kinase